ncbi:nitrogen fixation negative regulator NifL [Shewanella sp. C32]|uniref:histidine kinase n=1 Tax=Shewanella electrica TaxID=515560 RepID=A0ABT2FHW9_9GAMM|nr:nitrogen fixation negative regulator NifL [Shewanella electrica]MCH1924019.1 nitrogen fixation negative regulator NifL [Shewanella electrica]MCS4555922.1 nitrogen fixation negative regulator NifL [Shewanella electrica]
MEQPNDMQQLLQTPEIGLEAFEQILQFAPIAISITDRSGKLLRINKTFADITGYQQHELIGNNCSMLSYKATPRSVYESLWGAITRGEHWHGQLINRRKNGQPYIADISISGFRCPDGSQLYYSIHKDITEQHELQTHQKNQFTMFQAVLNSVPIAIAMIDNQHNVLFSNRRFEQLASSIQQSPITLLADSLKEESGISSIDAFIGSRPSRYKGIHIEQDAPSGERWFDYALAKIPVTDTTAEAYFHPADEYYNVVAISDRTKEKLLVEERRIHSVKLMASDNRYVHAMQEALMATLHQLQGPFNMIESAVKILKKTSHACPGLTAMDEAMINAVDAMNEIKQAIPERSNEAFQPVNINQVVRDATAISTDELLLTSTHLALSLSPTLASISGMPHRLVLALKQIIDNAIDAIQASKKDERTLLISTIEDDNDISIIVEDSGAGVDEQIRLKVFQPFYSTKPRHQSGCRGIGLSIVQQVLNEHSATISITESHQLGGASICLTFPKHSW